MATDLFLNVGDYHEGTFYGLFANPSFWDGGTAGYGVEGEGTATLAPSRLGAGGVDCQINTVAGTTTGLCGTAFCSHPLAADVTISGTRGMPWSPRGCSDPAPRRRHSP